MAHIKASVEPGVGDKQERADVLFHFSSSITLVDVTVIDNQCPSHMAKGAKALGAAAFKEREKMDKYEQKARSEGKTFYPLVFETTGGIGGLGENFLRLLSEETAVDVAKATFGCLPFTFFTRTLSFQLQVYNANEVLKGCRLVRGLKCGGLRIK